MILQVRAEAQDARAALLELVHLIRVRCHTSVDYDPDSCLEIAENWSERWTITSTLFSPVLRFISWHWPFYRDEETE